MSWEDILKGSLNELSASSLWESLDKIARLTMAQKKAINENNMEDIKRINVEIEQNATDIRRWYDKEWKDSMSSRGKDRDEDWEDLE